ncbi:MAG TPA: beta-L-arabinofuranosidase domain-containing protein [Polyangiaceae bacterium]|nr:beta-L-arabinofuranosidase domain-containing protein [Polyangiaceae bacterium]
MHQTKSPAAHFQLATQGFWARYTSLVRDTVIPYQWAALNDRIPDAAPSHAIRNFRIAAGLESGEFVGMVFQDSDVGKWIEAVAYSLETHPNPALETLVDETVELLEKAQAPDGYLNTYFTIKEPGRRWSNLWECHELYCAGHLLEGALAYYQATGKRRFLDVMNRYVDLIDQTFGPGPGQIRGYDGHEEIEIALLRSFDVTANPRHLALARFFLEERGREPYFFHAQWEALGQRSHWSGARVSKPEMAYFQCHLPPRKQTEAVGHAVRAVYLYAAMADLARRSDDAELRAACEALFHNVVRRQMYVTGGIGSTHLGEAFTFDRDLPNETAYAETCASIGLIFFAQRMLELSARAEFADVIELELFNTVLAGMSLDGQRFFYVNPLEVWPHASAHNPDRQHVKAERKAWFGCACCPPNLARLLLSLGKYVCQVDGSTLFLHQYISGSVKLPGPSDAAELRIDTAYPNQGSIALSLRGEVSPEFCLALRIPGWCRAFTLLSQGQRIELLPDPDGYVRLRGPWQRDHELSLELELEVQALEAHPQIRANAGKVCLRRGPLVYCFESLDNGDNLSSLSLDVNAGFETSALPELLPDSVQILVKGRRRREQDWDDQPYRIADGAPRGSESIELRAVPYHLWGNRGVGEMAVWLRRHGGS